MDTGALTWQAGWGNGQFVEAEVYCLTPMTRGVSEVSNPWVCGSLQLSQALHPLVPPSGRMPHPETPGGQAAEFGSFPFLLKSTQRSLPTFPHLVSLPSPASCCARSPLRTWTLTLHPPSPILALYAAPGCHALPGPRILQTSVLGRGLTSSSLSSWSWALYLHRSPLRGHCLWVAPVD